MPDLATPMLSHDATEAGIAAEVANYQKNGPQAGRNRPAFVMPPSIPGAPPSQGMATPSDTRMPTDPLTRERALGGMSPREQQGLANRMGIGPAPAAGSEPGQTPNWASPGMPSTNTAAPAYAPARRTAPMFPTATNVRAAASDDLYNQIPAEGRGEFMPRPSIDGNGQPYTGSIQVTSARPMPGAVRVEGGYRYSETNDNSEGIGRQNFNNQFNAALEAGRGDEFAAQHLPQGAQTGYQARYDAARETAKPVKPVVSTPAAPVNALDAQRLAAADLAKQRKDNLVAASQPAAPGTPQAVKQEQGQERIDVAKAAADAKANAPTKAAADKPPIALKDLEAIVASDTFKTFPPDVQAAYMKIRAHALGLDKAAQGDTTQPYNVTAGVTTFNKSTAPAPSAQPAAGNAATLKPATPGAALDKDMAQRYLMLADGDANKARQMAKQDGWSF